MDTNERQMRSEGADVDELRYEDNVPILKAREVIDALIAKYGEDAILEFGDVAITFKRPETDYERESRLRDEAWRASRKTAVEVALAKLTPEEINLLGVKHHTSR